MKGNELMLRLNYIGQESDPKYDDISLDDLIRRLTRSQDDILNLALYFDYTNGDLDIEIIKPTQEKDG